MSGRRWRREVKLVAGAEEIKLNETNEKSEKGKRKRRQLTVMIFTYDWEKNIVESGTRQS